MCFLSIRSTALVWLAALTFAATATPSTGLADEQHGDSRASSFKPTGPFPFPLPFVFDARSRLVLADAGGSANTYHVLPSGALSPASRDRFTKSSRWIPTDRCGLPFSHSSLLLQTAGPALLVA
jgi:hypothetical protein